MSNKLSLVGKSIKGTIKTDIKENDKNILERLRTWTLFKQKLYVANRVFHNKTTNVYNSCCMKTPSNILEKSNRDGTLHK